MKPERGTADMEDCVCDPIDLFVDLGMLITEGRIPDMSPKRRIEGPHCPNLEPSQTHTCDRHREQCRKADHFRRQMLMMCKNKIPMRVDVLLMPKCDHGQLEASSIDRATVSFHDNVMLLERWDVQIIVKRLEKAETGCVTGRFLLQAIRSYLHFSQLSSWMISSMGSLPFEVIYRLYAPGETVNYSFKYSPVIHNFPITDMNHATMRVSVASMPRPQSMPEITCEECMKGRQQKQEKFCKSHTNKDKPSERPHSSKSLGLDQYSLKSLESHHRRKKSDQSDGRNRELESDDNLCLPSRPKSPKVSDEDDGCDLKTDHSSNIGQSSLDVKSFYHKPPTGRKIIPEKSSETTTTDLKKDIKMTNNSMHFDGLGASSSQGPPHSCYAKNMLKESFKEKPLNFQQQPTHSKHKFDPDTLSKHYLDSDTLIKRLPSPKVLFTTNTKSQSSTYKKRKLDLDDLTENVEDKIMYSNLQDLMRPLRSDDLESYLSSLSNRVPVLHDSIHTIPLTKCKFFIGEHSNSGTDEKEIGDGKQGEDTIVHKSRNTLDSQKEAVDGSEITCNREINDTQQKEGEIINVKQREVIHPSDKRDLTAFHNEDHEPRKEMSSSTVIDKQSNSKQNNDTAMLHKSRDSVSKCLFKSLSEPGPGFEKLSMSLISDNKLSYLSHDGSPNGLSFTDDESSDNSTPTNSLSEHNGVHMLDNKQISTHNAFATSNDVKPTSHKGIEQDLNDSLENKLATLQIADSQNNSKKREEKMALGKSLCKHLMTKELNKIRRPEDIAMPNQEEIMIFQKNLGRSSSMMFNTATGLPTRSSPAPTKKKSAGGRFDFDSTLISTKAIKNALSCSKLALQSESSCDHEESQKVLSTSAPASTNCLLGNFEESVLNGRIEPVGVVEGFTAEIGAGGSFCPKHITLPVTAYFFQLSDDNAPSPYLGHINLEPLGKKGYKIPKCGTVQVTLFNPNKAVVKMFVVMYDLSDMPANCQTFLRQRTVYMPADSNSTEPTFLRYLIHLRFASSRSGKVYLHTDIRLIFARDKFEFDPRVANYELRSFTEGPQNPKFSPKR